MNIACWREQALTRRPCHRTTLFKTETSRRQILQIPVSIKSMLGKPAKWSRAAERARSDWWRKGTQSARRNLGWKIPASDWSRLFRHLLTLQFDTCGKNICSLHSLLLWSLLTNFGMFTSSPWKHAITHMLCALGKCKTNWTTMTLSHCICVTQKDNNSACFLKMDPKDAFFTWF